MDLSVHGRRSEVRVTEGTYRAVKGLRGQRDRRFLRGLGIPPKIGAIITPKRPPITFRNTQTRPSFYEELLPRTK